jgi:hypothetical protein
MDCDHIVKTGTISKKEICHFLGLLFPDGRCDYGTLHKHYFKDELLIDLGLSRDEYRTTRIFDRIKTKIIIGKLQLHFIKPRLRLLIN